MLMNQFYYLCHARQDHSPQSPFYSSATSSEKQERMAL